MADIRKVISRCNVKRHGWIHENLKSVNVNKHDAIVSIYLDPETGYALQSASMGKLTDVVLMLVIDVEEFNKYFREVRDEENNDI